MHPSSPPLKAAIKQLRALIKAGIDVDETGEYSPLSQAMELGRTDMVKELLKAGLMPASGASGCHSAPPHAAGSRVS
jgi:hypothetical protein